MITPPGPSIRWLDRSRPAVEHSSTVAASAPYQAASSPPSWSTEVVGSHAPADVVGPAQHRLGHAAHDAASAHRTTHHPVMGAPAVIGARAVAVACDRNRWR